MCKQAATLLAMAFNSGLQIPKLPGFSVPSSAVRLWTSERAPRGIPHHVPSLSLSARPDCVLALMMGSLKSNRQSMRGNHKKSSRFGFKDGQCVFTPREEEEQAKSVGTQPSSSSMHPLSMPSAEWRSVATEYICCHDCRCTQQILSCRAP